MRTVVGSRWYGNEKQMRSRDPTTETGPPKLRNSEGEAENTRNKEGEILTTDCRMNADRGLEENVRLCSLYWRKMFEAPDGERSSILQNARQTELGTLGIRPSEYQRQRLARTC